MILEKLDGVTDVKQNLFKVLKERRQKVFIYGAALTAKRICENLTKNNILIEGFFVDDCYFKKNLQIMDLPVFSTSYVMNSFEKFDIVIGFYEYKKAKEIMNNNEFQKKGSIFFFEEREMFNFDFLKKNLNKFEETYNWLNDDKSKQIFIAYLKSRLTGYPDELVEYCTKPQYFDECVKLSENEIFVDCGAFTGDTLGVFIGLTKGKYKKIYALEPDKTNFQYLTEITKDNKDIICLQKGVWDRGTILKFSSNADASNICNEGNVEIEVEPIDEIVKNDKVTFIKMDIEGSELKALKGAQNTIKRCMPKLAICVYHKKEDLFEIPQFIKHLDSQIDDFTYNLYLRHNSLASPETVLYGIPTKL